MYCVICTRGRPLYGDSMYAAFNSLSFMSTFMTLWMRALFTYHDMFITLNVQLLHFKSDFIALESSDRSAALQTTPAALTKRSK